MLNESPIPSQRIIGPSSAYLEILYIRPYRPDAMIGGRGTRPTEQVRRCEFDDASYPISSVVDGP